MPKFTMIQSVFSLFYEFELITEYSGADPGILVGGGGGAWIFFSKAWGFGAKGAKPPEGPEF